MSVYRLPKRDGSSFVARLSSLDLMLDAVPSGVRVLDLSFCGSASSNVLLGVGEISSLELGRAKEVQRPISNRMTPRL